MMVIVFTDTGEDHVSTATKVFCPLAEVSLMLNLAKWEFGKATGKASYLGKQVGHGQVHPVDANVTAVLSYPASTEVNL